MAKKWVENLLFLFQSLNSFAIMKKALIIGVAGQDGSYMAELLIKKKYKVYGFYRKAVTSNTVNIDHLIMIKKFLTKIF